ncbi:MAG: TonB family protein [Planctomycetota bacterium]
MNPPRGLFPCVVASSAALHAALGFVMPERGARALSVTSSVVEIADLLPSPPPPLLDREPVVEEPAPSVAAPTRVERTTTSARRAAAAIATAPAPLDDAPVDFTATVLSSADGPGVAVRTGQAAVATPAASQASPAVRRAPEMVPVHDLSRAPRPPQLDRVLERNYPADARRSGMSGTAILSVQILADGSVGVVRRVSQTAQAFGEACERTVRSGPWSPPIDRAGRPVATLITYTCRFEVKG